MNIKQMVQEHLKYNSYDGLSDGNGCGCGINDLMPCEEPDTQHCVQARRRKATRDDIEDGMDCEVGDEMFFPAED